jgi:hypothetical protein
MSRAKGKSKDHERALRTFAESEMSSDSEDGLDIIKSSRKGLDLSLEIDGQSIVPAIVERQR